MGKYDALFEEDKPVGKYSALFEEEKPAAVSPDVPATLGEQGRAAMDEWKEENPRSLTNVAKNIGGMAKRLGTEVVKAVNPIEAGKALGGYVAHPIESLKGSIKGLGQAGVGLVNAVPGAIQLISGVKNIEPVVTPPQWMQPSNPIQERTARYANLATMALPIGPKAAGITGKTIKKVAAPFNSEIALELAVQKGLDKGIKPRYTSEKKTLAGMEKFKNKFEDAVNTIADNRENINIVNEAGEKITRPQNVAQMAQAIDQTKKILYEKYNEMAIKAGDTNVLFNPNSIVKKLKEYANYKGNTPEGRAYAIKMIDEINELKGQSPKVIQDRIALYNESLKSFYENRTAKEVARIDASVANAMREELDNNITKAMGEGYQELKNKYGSLKAIEKDVNHRALQIAKSAPKNIFDLTDVFTGGEIISGLLTGNVGLLAKGVAGKGISQWLKKMNAPDRYIDNMFDAVYKSKKIPEPRMLNKLEYPLSTKLPENVTVPTYFRKGIKPETIDPRSRIKKREYPGRQEEYQKWEESLINKEKLGGIIEDINKPKKMATPDLDRELAIGKMIDEVSPRKIGIEEKQDMIDFLTYKYPSGKASLSNIREYLIQHRGKQ